jgi:hypothetical protein
VYRSFDLSPQKFGSTYEAFREYVHPVDRDLMAAAETAKLKTPPTYPQSGKRL